MDTPIIAALIASTAALLASGASISSVIYSMRRGNKVKANEALIKFYTERLKDLAAAHKDLRTSKGRDSASASTSTSASASANIADALNNISAASSDALDAVGHHLPPSNWEDLVSRRDHISESRAFYTALHRKLIQSEDQYTGDRSKLLPMAELPKEISLLAEDVRSSISVALKQTVKSIQELVAEIEA